jgi:outer membrane protein
LIGFARHANQPGSERQQRCQSTTRKWMIKDAGEKIMKTMINVAMLALLLGAGSAQAADFKVGVVSTERVLRESVPATSAEKKLEMEFSGRNEEIQNLIRQAKELQTLLEKEGAAMSDAEHRNKERELTAMNVDLQRMQREFREDLNLRKNEEFARVLELANKAVQTIAETEKFDLILQDYVYRNPNIDITDKVIKQLAADKPDVNTDSKDNKDGK